MQSPPPAALTQFCRNRLEQKEAKIEAAEKAVAAALRE
jgi:hypothetical protein